MDDPKVKNAHAVKAGNMSAAYGKARQDTLISKLVQLKETNLALAAESCGRLIEPLTSINEETTAPAVIPNSALSPLAVIASIMLVVVIGIYSY